MSNVFSYMAQDTLEKPNTQASASPPNPTPAEVDEALKKVAADTKKTELRQTVSMDAARPVQIPEEYVSVLKKVKETDLRGRGPANTNGRPAQNVPDYTRGRGKARANDTLQKARQLSSSGQPALGGAQDEPEMEAEKGNVGGLGAGLSDNANRDGNNLGALGKPQQPSTAALSSANSPGPSYPQGQPPEVPPGGLQNYLRNNQLAKSVITSGIGKQAEAKAIGRATSEVWWYGFGSASATFFSGLDFMLGAIVMNFYWFGLHRKNKQLFPLSFWQKALTVFASIAPLLYLFAIFFLVLVTICNSPTYKVATLFTGQAQMCQSFDLANIGSVLTGNPSSTINPPAGHVGNSACMFTNQGPASVANLSQSCFGQNAPQASAIAVAESGGIPTRLSRSDVCADGNVASVGLFQINLTNHQIAGLNCPKAFSSQFTASNHSCVVVDQTLYQQCVAAAEDPNNNIAEACTISHNGASWNQWGANLKCGF